jgi:hypothetical protein
MLVQVLVPEIPFEALDEGILNRFARRGEVQSDTAPVGPGIEATAETEASPGAYLRERLALVVGANSCAVLVQPGENLFRKVWSTGETTPTALVAGAASTALETNPSAIVMTDGGTVLAARIGKGESYPGLLLLGPRRGGRFYTTEERRLYRTRFPGQ